MTTPIDAQECNSLGAPPLPMGERVGVRGLGSLDRPVTPSPQPSPQGGEGAHQARRVHRRQFIGSMSPVCTTQPKTSLVMVLNQPLANTASCARAAAGALAGLTPPAPGTSMSCPLVGLYTPATENP